MTLATRVRIPLTGAPATASPTRRMEALLTASIVFGLLSIAGIFGVAVWAVGTR